MLLHELAKCRHQDYAALVSSSVVFTRRVIPPFGIIREGLSDDRFGSKAVTGESRLNDAVAPAGDTAFTITAAEFKRELIRALIGSCRD
jgi:hypothetical protein